MQPGWISVALAAFTVASLASGEQGPVQPIYHGRTLTEWVNIGLGPYSGASVDVAKERVRQIGTNALPLAIQWFQTKPVCLRPRTDTIGDAHFGATRIITNTEPFWIALDRAL